MCTRMVAYTQPMAMPRFATVMRSLAVDFGFQVVGQD